MSGVFVCACSSGKNSTLKNLGAGAVLRPQRGPSNDTSISCWLAKLEDLGCPEGVDRNLVPSVVFAVEL